MQAHNIYLQTLQSDKYGGLAVGLWLDNLYIIVQSDRQCHRKCLIWKDLFTYAGTPTLV